MSRAAEDTLSEQLKNPFEPKFIKWRIGQMSRDETKGTAFAYLDAREVYKRLDDVCGAGGWQTKFSEIKDGFICELSIRMPNGTWVTKSDAADQTDMEAVKGGASSALKRAAAVWGIGRYLYYLPVVWVPVKVLYTKRDGKNVYGFKEQPKLPDWALPNRVERWEVVAEMELTNNEPVDDTSNIAEQKRELLERLKAKS